MKKNKKATPFFAKFLEQQQTQSEQLQATGGETVVTLKYPSDWEDGTRPLKDQVVTLKFPSDDDEVVTLKHPSDDDEVVTLKFPSDDDEGIEL
jgi:hypothetical protein